MDIVLSQKDADWMLSVLRTKLSELDRMYEETIEVSNEKYDMCKQLADMAGVDVESDDDGEPLSVVKKRSDSRVYEDYKIKRAEYEKMICLLTMGSD